MKGFLKQSGMIAAIFALGGFDFLVVTAPPAAKLICGGALFYAFVRTAWRFWKA